jgi:NADPH:quinone reductase-like Zn-dependent oxidoreductase
VLQTRGEYQFKPDLPFVPGSEVGGIVRSAPEGAAVKEGDRVAAFSFLGAFADVAVAPEYFAFPLPDELSFEQGAALVLNYHTAYFSLKLRGRLTEGETVLVHGAAGRVGTAALELGALAGLRLIGTASARDRAAVERLGAVAIDYRNQDFLARVRAEAGGVDVVVDSLGGPISLRSFLALRPGGRLVVVGRYDTLKGGHKDWPAVIKWYAAIAAVWVWDKLSPRRRISAYHVQKYRDRATRRDGAVGGEPMDPQRFQEDFAC